MLLLRKGVCPYEYMYDWEKFNKTSLPGKQDFLNHLNMKDITNADYPHAKRVCKDFEVKNLGEYHDFFVQSDTLLLTGVFQFVIFKPLNCCFEETIGFDVKASFASCPVSRLIR